MNRVVEDISAIIVTMQKQAYCFWKFMTQTGLILIILYGKIDPYSGSKVDPEFWVKYVDSGLRVNLTRFASVAY